MIEISQDLIKKLNDLKKYTFFEILNLAGRVFIIVEYDKSVIIGKRGFLPEEKERGLILVFNTKMKFKWDNDAITATLIFQNTPESCYIPINTISTVFSPDLRIYLTTPVFKFNDINDIENKTDSYTDAQKQNKNKSSTNNKVIEISKFKRKK